MAKEPVFHLLQFKMHTIIYLSSDCLPTVVFCCNLTCNVILVALMNETYYS